MSADATLRAAMPDAPQPCPEARAAALTAALARFDEKNARASQGFPAQARPRHQGARGVPPARGRTMRRKVFYGMAAAAATVVVGAPLVGSMLTESSSLSQVATTRNGFDGPPPGRGTTVGQASTQMVTRVNPLAGIADGVRNMFGGSPAPAPSSPSFQAGGARTPGLPPHPGTPDGTHMAQAQEQGASAMPTVQPRALPPPAAFAQEQAARSLPPMPAHPAPEADQTRPGEPTGRDRFAAREANAFKEVRAEPVSTFSLDVDTASYGFVRASLNRNVLPPAAAVRTEEMLNYFPYDYPAPAKGEDAFRATVSVMPSPWNEGRKLVHVGIKAYAVPAAERPRANLVLLVDTSGSMGPDNRLPLAKQAFGMLVRELRPGDKVSLVTYAGSAGVMLEPTDAAEPQRIMAAIEALQASGGTAGGEGIRTAYALAERNFDPGAVNRILLATDGDFNVGISNPDELKGFVERKRATGIYLSVLGFGMGNYHDAMMQALAQNGNGVAAYIDGMAEARKVLVQEATSSVIPVADDAKAQVEFNPAAVAEYRLVGYEKRALRREDFNNDKVDAGEVGSGHAVTVLYEIVPVGGPARVDPLRYGQAPAARPDPDAEYGYVKLRYKRPGARDSVLMSQPVDRSHESASFDGAPQESRFAVAVAGFAELLRGGRETGSLTYDDVLRTAQGARGEDAFGYRSEFVQMVRAAKSLAPVPPRRP